MAQLHGEERVLMWLAVGQKHVMGQDRPSYIVLVNTYKLSIQ